jgi:V/A-type H+-transporting ATPase subunit I
MKKLRLIAMRKQKEALLRELIVLGCVEVSEPDELLEDEAVAVLAAREDGGAESRRSELAAVRRAIDILGKYAPAKSPMFAPRRDMRADEFFDGQDADRLRALTTDIDQADSRIRRLDAEEVRLDSHIESLLPWGSYKLPLSFEGTNRAGVLLGSVPLSVDLDELGKALSVEAPQSEVFPVSSSGEQHCIAVIYARECRQEVSDALRASGFSASVLKSIDVTAVEEIARTRESLAELREEREEHKARIAAAANDRQALRYIFDLAQTRLSEAEAAEKLIATERSVTLTGWIPAESGKALGELLARYDCAWEMRDPTEDETADVPVQLRNNSLTRPLTMVTEMYSLPAYNGVDPNPLMAPFFTLFFGIMMGDMGYGLIMMIAALLVKRKKPKGGMKTFFDLMLLCGVSTFVFGVVTGGFFGDAIFQYAKIINPDTRFTGFPWPTFDLLAGNNTLLVLVGSMAIGFLQIIVGMVINFVMTTRDGHLADAIMDQGSWWLLFAGIALGALGVTWYVAIAGVLALILTQGRSKPTIAGKIIGGLGSLYDITGYFGDILSYSRLMALMLAGSVIALVFNTLAAQTGKIAFFIVFIIGHALNFGLNLLGCYVHDLRLQCLEYFGKFYKDGGKPFRPLAINGKHVNIIK